jgi:hypothetical protein
MTSAANPHNFASRQGISAIAAGDTKIVEIKIPRATILSIVK